MANYGKQGEGRKEFQDEIIALIDALTPGGTITAAEIVKKLWPETTDTTRLVATVGRQLSALGLVNKRGADGLTKWQKPASWATKQALGATLASVAYAKEQAAKIVASTHRLSSAADVQKLADAALTPLLASQLEIALDRTKRDSDRLKAAEQLLDRLIGRPAQTIDLQVHDVRKLSTADLERMLADEPDAIPGEFVVVE